MPTTNKLTDARCRKAERKDKSYKLFDGRGLHLYISDKGAKRWRIAYRWEGKPQTYTIGPYPEVSLALARTECDKVTRKLALGENPKEPKKTPEPACPKLLEAAEAFWSKRTDVTEAYKMNAINGIKQHLGPKLGNKRLTEITRSDLLDALRDMDAAGLLVYVRAVRTWVSQVFDHHVEIEDCEINPAALINPKRAFRAPKRGNHASISPGEVPAFFERLSLEDELQSVIGCKLLALTWVRTSELRTMRWSELEGPQGAWTMWRIPEGKMKRACEHLVPLSREAVALLEAPRVSRRLQHWRMEP